MDEQNDERIPIAFSIHSNDPVGLILSTLLETRADISAMAVLLVRMYARVYDLSLEDALAEYKAARKTVALDHAFDLYDQHPKPPE